jgi:penicillin-insensitive murein DD-endopeptidase
LIRPILAFFIFVCLAAGAVAQGGPAPGPLRIIGGGTGGGCIAGAVSLPPDGPGFQTIHRDRSAFWGAPATIAGLQTLAREASAAGLPTLLVEDISRARGGPMPGGHISHQIGVDADVGLDMRPRPMISDVRLESVELTSMVRLDGRDIDPSVWSPRVIALLHLAATLPGVDRVLINPAIKQALCRDVTGDRSWLHTIRPWYDHTAHMHIHFRCPADQAECVDIAPIPAGDGCDATLAWWFKPHPAQPGAPKPAAKPAPTPAACRAILSGAG